MTKFLTAVAVGTLAASLCGASVLAAPAKMAAKTAKAAPSCPFCHMPLGTKMSAKMPVAIKMNGKTYYTCAPCKAKVAAMKPMKAMKTKAM